MAKGTSGRDHRKRPGQSRTSLEPSAFRSNVAYVMLFLVTGCDIHAGAGAWGAVTLTPRAWPARRGARIEIMNQYLAQAPIPDLLCGLPGRRRCDDALERDAGTMKRPEVPNAIQPRPPIGSLDIEGITIAVLPCRAAARNPDALLFWLLREGACRLTMPNSSPAARFARGDDHRATGTSPRAYGHSNAGGCRFDVPVCHLQPY